MKIMKMQWIKCQNSNNRKKIKKKSKINKNLIKNKFNVKILN